MGNESITSRFFLFSNICIKSYNFPLSAALFASHWFWYVVFSFSFKFIVVLIPLRLLWFMHYLKVAFKYLKIFLLSFFYWFLVCIHYGVMTSHLHDFSTFKFLQACLQQRIWFILLHILWMLEKNVWYAVLWSDL